MLDIGLEIRILRERLKVSAKELAEKVGLSQSQMSRLEKGERRIDTQILRRIAEVLKVSPSYFFRGAEAPAGGVIPPVFPRELGKLLRSERRKRHLSAEELAGRVGRPKAVIQSIEEGKRDLDPGLAESILKALRLPASYLLGAQEQVIRGLQSQVSRLSEALAEASRGALLLGAESGQGDGGLGGRDNRENTVKRRGTPVLGSLADGYPQKFDAAGRPVAEAEDFLYVPETGADDAFALHAVGDSMVGNGHPSFREGDLLIFSSAALRSRDFAFVRLASDAATFRQVFFEMGGQVRLQPLNLNYPARVHPREEVLGTWKLVGHVGRY